MDYLWTPWRFQYMAQVNQGEQPDCIFCDAVRLHRDEETFLVYRGKQAFVILNRFPYTSGHVMIVPYAHQETLAGLDQATAFEIMALAQRTEGVLRQVYSPDGINMGLNLGKAAGAGVAGHLHMHVLPRWLGDSNFMTVIAETRVLPETLETTWERLRQGFDRT